MRCNNCKWVEKKIKQLISYPTKKQGRRTKDGYPSEIVYDEFAYKRMVASFRDGLKQLLIDFEEKQKE